MEIKNFRLLLSSFTGILHDLFTKAKTKSVNALALALPASFYWLYLNTIKIDKDKIYGIKFNNLLYSSGIITIGFFTLPLSYKLYRKVN